jgi:hypothetical protein
VKPLPETQEVILPVGRQKLLSEARVAMTFFEFRRFPGGGSSNLFNTRAGSGLMSILP